MRVRELCNFISEREAIRQRKEAGLPRSKWTKDPILATYRFCNVHREDDRVTRWIASEWRAHFGHHQDFWFCMVFARLFNLPDTLAAVGCEKLLAGKLDGIRKGLKLIRADGRTIFNGAYIVSTNGRSMDKVDYLIDIVLRPMWDQRPTLRPRNGMTLALYHELLKEYDGMGSFMAAQVVADMKYVAPLRYAADWRTFAASGPGSRRGLNRVCERPTGQSWPGLSWHHALEQLHDAVTARLPGIPMHAQDLQNCLCEFDKYERVRLGEGRPKQLYRERV